MPSVFPILVSFNLDVEYKDRNHISLLQLFYLFEHKYLLYFLSDVFKTLFAFSFYFSRYQKDFSLHLCLNIRSSKDSSSFSSPSFSCGIPKFMTLSNCPHASQSVCTLFIFETHVVITSSPLVVRNNPGIISVRNNSGIISV